MIPGKEGRGKGRGLAVLKDSAFDFDGEEYKAAEGRLHKGLAALAGREGAPERLRDPLFADALMELMRLVLERNETISLTSITEMEEFVTLHLLDSLACVGLPELESAQRVIDVGSGAGFPGLPLAMLYPDKHFLLTDSLRKRVEFTESAASSMGLDNVEALHARAEAAGREPALRERFDLALCRAVGRLPVILEYCLPFVRVGGAGVFYKTVPAKGEIEESLLARELLGGGAEARVETYADILPGRRHALYIVGKEHPTPDTYPRRAGLPTKVPL